MKIVSIIMGKEENEVVKNITEYLEKSGYEVYRINNLAVRGRKFIGKKGFSDLVAFKPAQHILFIEVKKPTEKPTNDQYRFLVTAILTEHAFGIWADSFQMFLEKMKTIKARHALYFYGGGKTICERQ